MSAYEKKDQFVELMAGMSLVDESRACADDEVVSVVSFSDEEEVVDLSVNRYEVLVEEAVSAQRLGVMRNVATYVKGSHMAAVIDPNHKYTPEKVFQVSGLFDWTAAEPVEVVEAMREKRVRARVSAAMGVGKSTFLPFYIASQMDHRVLYVAPDATAISEVNRYVRSTGRGRIMRMWSERVSARVCCQTYHDFVGYMGLMKRAELFRCFDTIIFDEAFHAQPTVAAALKVFAVAAGDKINLLLCSANIRTDEAGLTAESSNLGSLKVLKSYVAPEQAMASGKLVSDYLVDRTLVILPGDERVHDMRAYYEESGVEVQALDSASGADAVLEVMEWLQGDSVTPRVVVATTRFALGYSFPVAYAIIWPVVERWDIVGDEMVRTEVPMSRSLVGQAVSRTGRGLVNGSGGVIMGPDRGEEHDLGLADKLEEFVMLFSCRVRPMKSAYWADCYKLFPQGLDALTAHQLLKINLPVFITARYLASDGYFAGKFARPLTMFAKMGHSPRPSSHEYPVGYEKWQRVEVLGSESKAFCQVPVKVAGEWNVIMQAVSCMAEERIALTRWQAPSITPFYDKGDDRESNPNVAELQMKRLRRIRSFEKPVVPTKVVIQDEPGWSYEARVVNQTLGGAGTRKALVGAPERFEEAVKSMRSMCSRFQELQGTVPIVETEVGTVGQVELPPGVVVSPGGSEICTLPASVCEGLNCGRALSYMEVMHLVDAYRVHGDRVVASRVFDNFSKPWTSVCATFMTDSVLKAMVASGTAVFAYQFLAVLHARFRVELVAVVRSSHVFKTRYYRVFRRQPTLEQMMNAIRAGKFNNIAQSNAFINRVMQLKTWMDTAYVMAERHGVYLPMQITEAQRTLPMHPETVIGSVASRGLAPTLAETENPMSSFYRG